MQRIGTWCAATPSRMPQMRPAAPHGTLSRPLGTRLENSTLDVSASFGNVLYHFYTKALNWDVVVFYRPKAPCYWHIPKDALTSGVEINQGTIAIAHAGW